MGYRERLSVPASWWVLGMFFAVTFITAVGLYLDPLVSIVGGVVVALGVAVALLWYGSPVIEVTEEGLLADHSLLEWDYLGEVQAHDAAATRNRLGRGADHHAHLVLRSYLRTSVEVTVDDADDPHPYWLVSTRHPAELAEAVARARSLRMPR